MENLLNGVLTLNEEHVDFIKPIAGEFDYEPKIMNDAGEEVINVKSPLYFIIDCKLLYNISLNF